MPGEICVQHQLVAEIDVDRLHQLLESFHQDRPQPAEFQVIDGRQKMAVGPIPRPTVDSFRFPAACQLVERRGRLHRDDRFDQLERQAVIVQQFRLSNGHEFDAELAQDPQFLAIFIFAVFRGVAHADRGNVARRGPHIGAIDGNRVSRIGAVDRGKDQSAVVGAAADRPDRIERPAQLHAAVPAHAPVGWTQPDGAAAHRRVDNAAGRIRRNREADESGGRSPSRSPTTNPLHPSAGSRDCGSGRGTIELRLPRMGWSRAWR